LSNDQSGCGAPAGGYTVTADAAGKEAIVEGHVTVGGVPASTGYARLRGSGDEFVAEVPLGEDGGFRRGARGARRPGGDRLGHQGRGGGLSPGSQGT
jgi:hypothetical protein